MVKFEFKTIQGNSTQLINQPKVDPFNWKFDNAYGGCHLCA